jgi:hypothetical protein
LLALRKGRYNLGIQDAAFKEASVTAMRFFLSKQELI